MVKQSKNAYRPFLMGRTPQQDPQSPNKDPAQKNPKLPEEPIDTPRPQPDPGKQPIDQIKGKFYASC